ncbi:hypothetical protein KKG52_02630 [Patescibacteria group bacterium]|nr:hypothetical protein [Patescibacteria group bacterium]
MGKLLSFLRKKPSRKSLVGYKEDLLQKQGREQFKKLLEKGIGIPVTLL